MHGCTRLDACVLVGSVHQLCYWVNERLWGACRAAGKYPKHGRIVVTQLSIGVGIPMTILLLKVRSARHTSHLLVENLPSK